MQMNMTHRSGDCYFFNQRKSGVGLRAGSCVNIQSGYIRYQNTGNGLRHQRGYKAAKNSCLANQRKHIARRMIN